MNLNKSENPSARIVDDLYKQLQSVLANGDDINAFAHQFIKANLDSVIVCDEIGMGIVPIEKNDRIFREAVGRVMCLIAKHADHVTRVTCGIGVQIK